MTRQPTGPDAGADDGDPSVAAAGGNNGQLSRSMILQTALSIVDRDGVDRLSMRRLSVALGSDPVMLYRHVANFSRDPCGSRSTAAQRSSYPRLTPAWSRGRCSGTSLPETESAVCVSACLSQTAADAIRPSPRRPPRLCTCSPADGRSWVSAPVEREGNEQHTCRRLRRSR
jgi:hypothetical protein